MSSNKNEIYELNSQHDRLNHSHQRNLEKSSLNLDLSHDVHQKSIKNGSNNDDVKDIRSKIEIEKDCFIRCINNSTASNTPIEDRKNVMRKTLPKYISVNLLEIFVSNKQLALKPRSSLESSINSDEDEKILIPYSEMI